MTRWLNAQAGASPRPCRDAASSRTLGALLVGAATLPLLPVAPRRRAVPTPTKGDAGRVRLLALLRDRRLPVRLLRRLGHDLPARARSPRRHLGRHLPQRGRRPELHRLLQRLLRQELVRALPLQPQRGRRTAVSPSGVERLQLVRRQQREHPVSLHGFADRRGGRQDRLNRAHCTPADGFWPPRRRGSRACGR